MDQVSINDQTQLSDSIKKNYLCTKISFSHTYSLAPLGPLDWILGTLVGFIADLIRGFLGDILEGPIKDALANVLANIDIPLPGCS